MALLKRSKVIRFHIPYIALVHFPGSDEAVADKLPQPGRSERVVLVIIGAARRIEARRVETRSGSIACDESRFRDSGAPNFPIPA
jgi:hypothetical protein